MLPENLQNTTTAVLTLPPTSNYLGNYVMAAQSAACNISLPSTSVGRILVKGCFKCTCGLDFRYRMCQRAWTQDLFDQYHYLGAAFYHQTMSISAPFQQKHQEIIRVYMILSGKASLTRCCASRNYKNNLPHLWHVRISFNIVHIERINHSSLVHFKTTI